MVKFLQRVRVIASDEENIEFARIDEEVRQSEPVRSDLVPMLIGFGYALAMVAFAFLIWRL